jgi:tetratricopeptide (TPR) repeat protein
VFAAALTAGLVAIALAACGGSSGGGESNGDGGTHASYSTLVGAGVALLQQGNTGAAAQLFQQAIASKPHNPVAYYDLGVAYQRESKTGAAGRAYFAAIHYGPNYVPALYNLAGIVAQRNPPLAIFYYRRIVHRQPDSPTAFLNLGLLEARGHRVPERALRDLAQAVRLDPSLRADVPASLRAKLPAANKG